MGLRRGESLLPSIGVLSLVPTSFHFRFGIEAIIKSCDGRTQCNPLSPTYMHLLPGIPARMLRIWKPIRHILSTFEKYSLIHGPLMTPSEPTKPSGLRMTTLPFSMSIPNFSCARLVGS